MANLLAFAYDKMSAYPDKKYAFSPDVFYPEYPWNKETLALKKNSAYNLVRECFRLANLDLSHYGTAEWNPLGLYIKPGNVILIKPNWVMHRNKNEEVINALDCLVTNPSVMRAIIDYVVIALKGSGKIIIADAPMQSCDLQQLFETTGYDKLFSFYHQQNIEIEVADLRKYSVICKYSGVISKPFYTEYERGGFCVELGSSSMHAQKDCLNPAYKVTDYRMDDTRKYHQNGSHCYEVSKIPFEADVVISIPKPKTHRLAGMTGTIKNMVGITYDKACLPHRIEGDQDHGGDAYLKHSRWKKWMHFWDERRTKSSLNGAYQEAKLYDLLMKICYVMGALISRDPYRIGSWYGNDTIWRTAVDLNTILMCTDQYGTLHETQRRKIITIADMIICGEKKGPVSPSPKPLGMVMLSDNSLLFDRVMCEIMGFDVKKFPVFHSDKALHRFGYDTYEALNRERIYSNLSVYNNIEVGSFEGSEAWAFEAHPCWKGYIEK